jgi:hypothetical protein
MRNNQVLFDSGSFNNNLDNPCYYRAGIPLEQTRFSHAAHTFELEADSEFYDDRIINGFSLMPDLQILGSVFRGIGLAIKVSILVALSIVWAVLALPLVLLYLAFFKSIFDKLNNRIRQSKRKSPYYYKWKKHHLDLNWEA